MLGDARFAFCEAGDVDFGGWVAVSSVFGVDFFLHELAEGLQFFVATRLEMTYGMVIQSL